MYFVTYDFSISYPLIHRCRAGHTLHIPIVRRHLARSVGREELLPLGEHGGFSLVEVVNFDMFDGIVMFYNLASITASWP